MYAAAQAKPQSIEVEHVGPAATSGPHLVATYKPGREIYAQGDLNDKCYQVSTGAVRVYHLLSDGRRQVVSFHLPGEMFGFEAGSTHFFFAEAITETTLAIFRRRHMQERSRKLLALALTGMARAQQHLLVIGRQCAVERIAAFLVDLCERQGGGRQLRLPMSRQDIADYLGLTIETVSLMSSMRDGDGFRVPPDAVRTFEDGATRGARRRLAANARVSDERQRLHMPPARGDHAYDIVRHFVAPRTDCSFNHAANFPI